MDQVFTLVMVLNIYKMVVLNMVKPYLMKTQMQSFAENLTQYVFNPSRLMRLCNISLYDYTEIVG